MGEYTATVQWERGRQPFVDNRYSRRHAWMFDGGVTVPASASPHVVPVPLSDAQAVDPEEAFVAALASCHMLWFLSIAARRNFCVDRYADHAVGILEKDSVDKLSITRVTLRPQTSFSGVSQPTKSEIEAMHDEAHQKCYIANSVKTDVRCEPT